MASRQPVHHNSHPPLAVSGATNGSYEDRNGALVGSAGAGASVPPTAPRGLGQATAGLMVANPMLAMRGGAGHPPRGGPAVGAA